MSRKALFLALCFLLTLPSSAWAAGGHIPLASAGILGSIFGTIGHAVLGAFSWTISLASKFVLTTIAALVKLLIPHAWVGKGLQIVEWIVAIPDYAGKITTPGGGHQYGFAGINALRELFMWLGIAVVPLSLTYATGQAMIGESEPIPIPVVRVVTVAAVVAAYPYWWAQAAALSDQITHAILTLPDVSQGLYKLMDYAVDGVALGGWQLVDLGLMAAIGFELLGLIFLKVVVILLGALLYATGPLMIGLVPTRAGGALARAWASAAVMLFALGIGWATVFAVGALLIGDAGTAGPLIAGNSTFGSLMGGLMLALAGLASLWFCLKLAKEAGGLLRLQFAGLLSLTHFRGGPSSGVAGVRGRTTGQSLRSHGSRVARASTAAGGEFAGAVPAGAALGGAGRAAGYVGRRGLIGTAASGARAGAQRATGSGGLRLGRSRAGAVAVRMARAGTASWSQTRRSSYNARTATPQGDAGLGQTGASGRRVDYSQQRGRTTTSRATIRSQAVAALDRKVRVPRDRSGSASSQPTATNGRSSSAPDSSSLRAVSSRPSARQPLDSPRPRPSVRPGTDGEPPANRASPSTPPKRPPTAQGNNVPPRGQRPPQIDPKPRTPRLPKRGKR
jgi:hypothetical protein